MCTEFLVPPKWNRQDYQYVVILLYDFYEHYTSVWGIHNSPNCLQNELLTTEKMVFLGHISVERIKLELACYSSGGNTAEFLF